MPDSIATNDAVQDAIAGTFLPGTRLEAMLHALRRKKNLIIQGPPGVGKTFLSKRLAHALIGRHAPANVQMIQFHPSYAYEDFVQGWRPTANGFERRDGIFYEFCRLAQSDPGSSYVFVIDEVNRGNLAKVFGEVFSLIEVNKRGIEHAIPLTYATDGTQRFYVPENLYLIGLMNTADRSIAMVDYALRRRFAFINLEPAFAEPAFAEFLRAAGVDPAVVSAIVKRLTVLNRHIQQDAPRLGPGYEIGHSYFCPQNGEVGDWNWYREIITTEVAPLLAEYWFDDPERVDHEVRELHA